MEIWGIILIILIFFGVYAEFLGEKVFLQLVHNFPAM